MQVPPSMELAVAPEEDRRYLAELDRAEAPVGLVTDLSAVVVG